jgi:hypothetical protein
MLKTRLRSPLVRESDETCNPRRRSKRLSGARRRLPCDQGDAKIAQIGKPGFLHDQIASKAAGGLDDDHAHAVTGSAPLTSGIVKLADNLKDMYEKRWLTV